MKNKFDEILQFWFDDVVENPECLKERNKFWFQSSPEVDKAINTHFKDDIDAAAQGQYDEWVETARDALALIILFDQFPRNIYRGTAQAFAFDALSLARCQNLIASGRLIELHPIERAFALMPLQHCEELEVQNESVYYFAELARESMPAFKDVLENNYQYAKDHLDIIQQFGRFPHRNLALGRESTTQEVEYLASGGKTFGQG